MLTDEKTLKSQIPGTEHGQLSLRLTIDSNPIMIRVNLNHSMHEPKHSGASKQQDVSAFEDTLEVQTFSTCSIHCLKYMIWR